MKTLIINDNEINTRDYFDEVKNVTSKIADRTLEKLEKDGVFVFPELVKDAEDITKDQMIIQSENENYRSGNVMGFLGYGKERLVIKSRFSNENEDYFFQYLLEMVLDFPNILELNTETNQDTRIFNLLIFLFPYYLKTAMRKGKFKMYIRNHYNNGNVKGIIDIGRHIQENTPFVGNIAYNQREFSYDNYLMEIIRHTIEFIKKKTYGNKVLRKVKDEVAAVISSTENYEYYDRRKVVIENKKNPIRHAYYHEYIALQRLCIMILQHDKHQIGNGIKEIHGILFDGAWLWEEYINLLIGDTFYHPMNKGGKGAQRLFSAEEGSKVGLIYPDFIGRDKDNKIIADAKYKPIDNIGNRDYLQILAYMFRFDSKQGYYLYPEKCDIDKSTLKMNQGSTYENNVVKRDDISVTKCGLKIPCDTRSYEEFKEKIYISEKEFLLNFKSESLFNV